MASCVIKMINRHLPTRHATQINAPTWSFRVFERSFTLLRAGTTENPQPVEPDRRIGSAPHEFPDREMDNITTCAPPSLAGRRQQWETGNAQSILPVGLGLGPGVVRHCVEPGATGTVSWNELATCAATEIQAIEKRGSYAQRRSDARRQRPRPVLSRRSGRYRHRRWHVGPPAMCGY